MNPVWCPYCTRYVMLASPYVRVYPHHADLRGGECWGSGREVRPAPSWRPLDPPR